MNYYMPNANRNTKMIDAVGSRAKVGHGTARRTAGGLTRSDLKKHPKTGRWVSVKASALAKKRFSKVKAIFARYQYRK